MGRQPAAVCSRHSIPGRAGDQDAPARAFMKLPLNGEPYAGEGAGSVAELLAQLKLEGRRVAVMVNDEIVRRQDHAARQLADGDRIEIIHMVGGG